MVLNNVTKFHKILIKCIRVREWTPFGQTYVRTGVTLNAPAIVMAGALKSELMFHITLNGKSGINQV